MEETVFFVQRGIKRAFITGRSEIRNACKDLQAKRLKMIFNHPLGKLTYRFDRKNSDKIKEWIEGIIEAE